MNIQDDKSFKNIGLAIAGGATATAVHAALLPSEAKLAIKNTMFGQDHFINKTIRCAKTSFKNTGKSFNLENGIRNAESKYSVFEYMAKITRKQLLNTFAATAGVILAVKATQSAIERITALKNQQEQ